MCYNGYPRFFGHDGLCGSQCRVKSVMLLLHFGCRHFVYICSKRSKNKSSIKTGIWNQVQFQVIQENIEYLSISERKDGLHFMLLGKQEVRIKIISYVPLNLARGSYHTCVFCVFVSFCLTWRGGGVFCYFVGFFCTFIFSIPYFYDLNINKNAFLHVLKKNGFWCNGQQKRDHVRKHL